MGNVLHVKFGEARDQEELARDLSRVFQDEPFFLSKHNSDLLAGYAANAFKRFRSVAAATISFHKDASTDEITAKMQAYAMDVQAACIDEMTKLYLAALAYGCAEAPIGR